MISEWNAIAVRTIFTEATLPPPVAQLYFGMVSTAVYDAVVAVKGGYQLYGLPVADHGHASAEAAAATAAYQVLRAFFPASTDKLAADYDASLAASTTTPRPRPTVSWWARARRPPWWPSGKATAVTPTSPW